jgi:phenylacetate-coenzyme A ligase PaaK-like adenylate-forming protein
MMNATGDGVSRPTRRAKVAQLGRALKEARAMRANERLDPGAARARRQSMLEALVADARAGSSWWRDRLPAGQVRLEDLPTTTKRDLVDDFEAMVCGRSLEREQLLGVLRAHGSSGDFLVDGDLRVMATSGSSGTPGLFVYDTGAWTAQMAQTVRASEWVGITPSIPRKRIAAISGSNPAHMTRRLSESLDVGLHRVLRFGVTDPIDEIIAGLEAFKPDMLVTYPSLLPPLTDAVATGRLRIAPDAVQTTSEPLTPALRELCEGSFGTRPYDFFGCTEGLFATECDARNGMHLYEDCTIVEVVDADNNPVPDGEPGMKMLLTNLNNRVQPIIRLEVSDSVTTAAEPCSCGRTLRRLRAIDGRLNDILRLGGVDVHPQRFGLLGRDPAVRAFQVVQRGEGVRLRLVLEGEAPGTAARLSVETRAELERAGVRDPQVETEPVASIERAASGKIQQIVAESAAQPAAPDSRGAVR